MTWPATVIVDVVFIPIYLLLLAFSIFNVVKHGTGKVFGFISVCIFSAVRLIGNILLVYAYNDHYRHQNAATWGFILQALGYSFLVNATLALYKRATTIGNPTKAAQLRGKPLDMDRILHLVTLGALILLITGYNDSDVFSNSSSSSMPSSPSSTSLDGKAKAGDLIYVGLTVFIGVLCSYRLFFRGSDGDEPRTILSFVLGALPFMLCRAVYAAAKAFSDDALQGSLWAKVVFDYIAEVIVVVIFFVMGLCIGRLEADAAADLEAGGGKSRRDRRLERREGFGATLSPLQDFQEGTKLRGPNDNYIP